LRFSSLPAKTHLREGKTEGVVGFVKDGAGFRKIFGEFLAHTRVLGGLPGKT